MNRSDIILYFGDIVIVSLFIYLNYVKFKDFEEIDLNKHKWIILLYIFLLIFAIIIWRIVFLLIQVNFFRMMEYNQIIQRAING